MNNIRYISFMAVMLFMTISAYAQTTVKGQVCDKFSGQTIDNAVIYLAADDLAYVTTTDTLGQFIVDFAERKDSITIKALHVAYEDCLTTVPFHDELTISMSPKSEVLDEVVVKADWIIRKGIKSVINISQMPNAENMEMDRILKRIPGVMETGEGTYTLNGKNAVIFVNGIEQKISGKSLDAFLSSLPSKAIKSVELIPINSGKYKSNIDAVIDIKLNNNVPLGHSLHVNTNMNYKDNEINDAGINLFYMTKINRLLFHNTLTYSNESNRAVQTDSLFYNKQLISGNDVNNEGRDNALVYQANLSYNLKNENNIIFNTFIYNDFGKSESKWKNGNMLTNQFQKRRNDLYNFDVSYQIPSSKKRFNGAVSYSFSYGGRHADMEYPLHVDKMETEGQTDMEGWMNMVNMDFSSEIGSWTFDYGTQGEYNSVWDRSIYKMTDAREEISRMTGREILAAVYANAVYKFNEKLSLLAGGRLEHTDYKYNVAGVTNRMTFTDFFPSLVFFVNTSSYDSKIGFISNINRPNYQDMLPGIHKINDYMYQKGNPNQTPANSYYLLFYNTLFDFLELNFTYAYTKDALAHIYDINEGKCLIWKENAADLDYFYANVVLPFTFFDDKLTGQFQWGGSYRYLKNYKNGFEVPENRKNYSFRTSYNLMVNYKPNTRLNIMSSFNYVPKTEMTFSSLNRNFHMNIEADYSFLKDKNLTIGLSIKDCFNNDVVKESYFLSGERKVISSWRGPTAGITLRYKFNRGQNVVDEYRDYSPKTSRF